MTNKEKKYLEYIDERVYHCLERGIDKKQIAEYPTAVPISNILSGFLSFSIYAITSNVSSIIIGIWSANAFSFISSNIFILPV